MPIITVPHGTFTITTLKPRRELIRALTPHGWDSWHLDVYDQIDLPEGAIILGTDEAKTGLNKLPTQRQTRIWITTHTGLDLVYDSGQNPTSYRADIAAHQQLLDALAQVMRVHPCPFPADARAPRPVEPVPAKRPPRPPAPAEPTSYDGPTARIYRATTSRHHKPLRAGQTVRTTRTDSLPWAEVTVIEVDAPVSVDPEDWDCPHELLLAEDGGYVHWATVRPTNTPSALAVTEPEPCPADTWCDPDTIEWADEPGSTHAQRHVDAAHAAITAAGLHAISSFFDEPDGEIYTRYIALPDHDLTLTFDADGWSWRTGLPAVECDDCEDEEEEWAGAYTTAPSRLDVCASPSDVLDYTTAALEHT